MEISPYWQHHSLHRIQFTLTLSSRNFSFQISNFSRNFLLAFLLPTPTPLRARRRREEGGARRGRLLLDVSQRYAGDYVIQRDMHVHARSSFACPFVPRSFHVTASLPPSFPTIHPIKFNFDAARRPFFGSPKPGRRLHTEGRAIAAIIAPASNRYTTLLPPHLPF